MSGDETTNTAGDVERGKVGSDLTTWPVLRLFAPNVAEYPAVDVPSFFVGIDEALGRQLPFVTLFDARGLPPIDLDGRIEFVGMVNARRPQLRSYMAAFAAVVSSPFERGLVTAFSWFANPPLPVRLFAAADEAQVWLQQRLSAFDSGPGPSGRPPA